MDTRTVALWKKHENELPPLEAYPLLSCRFTAGEVLASPGEPPTRLCFVVEGLATVHNTMENGRALLLREYRGVQTIGELEFLLAYPTHTSEVRATTRGALLYIPLKEPVRAQMEMDAAMLRYLGRVVASKLEHSNRVATQDRLYPLAARLAAYLLYCQHSSEPIAPLTRISELMGTSYRHLLRTLHTFCEQGMVIHVDGHYRVADAHTLTQLAGQIRYD